MRIKAANTGELEAWLIRNQQVIAQRTSHFEFTSGSNRLRRHAFAAAPTTQPVGLFVVGERRQELGLASETNRQKMILTDWNSGTLWLVILPLGGAGGGPPDEYVFERVAAR